ncbi:MAG: hypothetical protein KDH17_11360 [Rhodocyclaceae bacterium]|nr:hypothetical protein [Rhodocyclaceae bacterium]
MNANTARALRRSPANPTGGLPVVAGLNYLVPTGERPFSYACEPPAGAPWESGRYELRQMAIADARSGAPSPAIDVEGFELWEAPTVVRDFFDPEEVRATYYAEATELALAVTGAQRAHVFDHLVRRRERDRAPVSFGRKPAAGPPAVNGRIHSDYTEASGRRRLAMVLSDALAAARVERYAIINIWRSIKGPVRDTPLAVCDARSVAASDLVESEVRYPRRTGEIYHARHSPRHRWSYFSGMDRHEALIFKQYDSRTCGVARFVLHTAFDLPQIPADAPLRESIELRCLVIYD